MVSAPATSRGARGCSDASTLHAPAALSAVWESAWSRLVERVGAHFARADARAHAGAYLKGLLSPVERKNGWQLAEVVGDPTPYALQHLLGRARWNADAVRDDLRDYVVEHLGDPRGVLVIDETGFVKKGTHSAGVQRTVQRHGRSHRELPDRRLPRLRNAARAHFPRPRPVLAGLVAPGPCST